MNLSWLAGFVDADGSIGMSRPSTQGGYVVQVQVTGTDQRAFDAITVLYRKLGVGFNIAARHNDLRGLARGRTKHAKAWHITVARRQDALRLLRAIEPLLVCKRDRAVLCIEFLERRCMSVGRGPNAHPYTDRDHEIFATMRHLQTAYKEFANV